MSDLIGFGGKVQQGSEWRGQIDVSIEGETYELTIRQLYDPEMRQVMELLDFEELEALGEQIEDSELWDRYEELEAIAQDDDAELTDEQAREYEQVQHRLEDEGDMLFDELSGDTYKGLRLCAKFAVVPDREDVSDLLTDEEMINELEDEYDERVRTRDDARRVLNQYYDDMLDRTTGMTSYMVGLQALMEQAEDSGKS